MSLFNNILLDISKKLRSKELYKEDISHILSLEIGTTISKDDIQIKNGVLFVNTSPTIKSTILLKKQKLLKALENYKIYTIG